MAKDWDRENMKTLGANMKKEDAEAFRKLAEERGTTVGALIRGFVQGCLTEQSGAISEPQPWGVAHVVSYKNTDRLKKEVAFHNPRNLNPDQMLNEILDRYFALADDLRK